MVVADAQDGRVYSYNPPGVIDARLGSLALSGIELNEFSAAALSYQVEVGHEVEQTTVEATPAHEGASVVIEPADVDDDRENGRQVAVDDDTKIEITVTSEDGSRTRVYTVAIERANEAPTASDIPLVELTAGGEPTVLDLDDYFSDPDGDPLSYTLGESSDDAVATVKADGAMPTIIPQGSGAATLEVTASDGELESEARTIEITVAAPPIEVRLTARPVASGAVEFGLQERAEDGSWRERVLPRLRFLQTDSEVDRWRVSSPIEAGEGDTAGTVRIAARRVETVRVECALVIRQQDGSWSARLLPRARILPADSVTGRWRYSTPVVIGSPWREWKSRHSPA